MYFESWRKVWRDGVAHHLSTAALSALASGLQIADARMVQGATCSPPPLQCCAEWPIESACPLGFGLWQGDGLQTVGQLEEAFAVLCQKSDESLGEPAAIRWLLNWLDDSPRETVRQQLLEEVHRSLAHRNGPAEVSPAA
jgi:hypothetical protein